MHFLVIVTIIIYSNLYYTNIMWFRHFKRRYFFGFTHRFFLILTLTQQQKVIISFLHYYDPKDTIDSYHNSADEPLISTI